MTCHSGPPGSVASGSAPPFEQDAHGFGPLLLHGVLQRSPPGVVEVWKDECAFGDTRCVQIDASSGTGHAFPKSIGMDALFRESW